MRTVLILAAALMLAACPSVPMATLQDDIAGKSFAPPPPGTAALYIVHDSGVTGAPALTISLGPRLIGGLTNDAWFRLDVPPGNHDVRAAGRDGSGSLDVTVAAGETRYLVATYARWTLTGIVSEVPPDQGRPRVVGGARAKEIR